MASTSPTIDELLPSWRRALRAKSLSERTITSYDLAADQLIDFLTADGHTLAVADITHRDLQGFLGQVLATRASATAKQRYASLRQLFNWLTLEEEITVNPFDKMSPPRVVETPVPVLTTEQLAALIAVCKGNTFDDCRDEALIRMFIDTGVRLGEMVGLNVSNIDLDLEVAVVLGKGRRLRSVPFGHRTTTALDRYTRRRRLHPAASSDSFWLGLKGPLSSSGISQVVLRRGAQAGLGRVHPHQFRHTFAHRWLSAGGSEGDLQRLAGWQSAQMLQRYGRSSADQRAVEAHRRLALGDDL